MDDEDTFTQFSYACHQLGVAIKTSSVPQAKGRVERLNQTLQSRLPVELRISGITCIEVANAFLPTYIKEYNKGFSIPLNTTKTVFEKQPTEERINQILAILTPRKVDAGHCIKYKNKYYIPHTMKGIPLHLKKGSDALVVQAFDGNLYASILDEVYILEEIKEREEKSKEFDYDYEVDKKPKKKWIQPKDPPWRISLFTQHLNSQTHRNNGANI